LHYHSEGKKPTKKSIALGTILDKRFFVKGGKLDAKDVKMSMEEIRRILIGYIEGSGRFERSIKIFPDFSGEKFSDLTNSARKSDCDYLIVGEVTKFDIKFYGANWLFIPTITLDTCLLPLNIFVFIITAGESLIFSGGLVAVAIVEVRLSMSFNMVDVRTGRVVKTFVISERVRDPATSFQMVGYFYDSSDDWLDLGRKLGADTAHNLSIRMTDQFADFIIKSNNP